ELEWVEGSGLGGERVTRTGQVEQGQGEQQFAHPATVKGGGVDKVEPAIERQLNAPERLVEGDLAKLLTQRTRAETHNGKAKAGSAEGSLFHGRGNFNDR